MRYLHTMLRVRNLDNALKFYRDALGLKEVRRVDNDKAKYTLLFLCAPEDEGLLKAARGRAVGLNAEHRALVGLSLSEIQKRGRHPANSRFRCFRWNPTSPFAFLNYVKNAWRRSWDVEFCCGCWACLYR